MSACFSIGLSCDFGGVNNEDDRRGVGLVALEGDGHDWLV
jgi:hypothetical protein